MAFKWLEPDEKPEVFWHSSISQEKHTLSVLKRGEWVHIAFDSLDYITCDQDAGLCGKLKAVSHRAILTDKPDIGYRYCVKECSYLSKTLVTNDHVGVVTKALPVCMGKGEYQAYVNNRAFVNSDNEAIGVVQDINLRIGTAYALAKRTLPADE